MAGLFERMGLVRTEYEGMPETPMQPVSEPMYAPETPVIDATQVSYDDVIASIYQQGDIDDENSIFKIKAYIDILPLWHGLLIRVTYPMLTSSLSLII